MQFWKISSKVHNVLKLIIVRCSHTRISKKHSAMDLAYFRHESGQDSYHLTFLLKVDSLKIDRQFNFTRPISESIGKLTDRIQANVDKCKQKKKKGKIIDGSSNEISQPIEVKFLQNGDLLAKDTLCSDISNTNSLIQLVIMDNVFRIVVNSPWIQSIQLPASILAGFSVYPCKFETSHVSKKHCTFHWYTALLGEKTNINVVLWTHVGEGLTYCPSTADIGKRLKVLCIPGNETTTGPGVEAVAVNNVEAGPGFCPFQNRHEFTKENTSGNVFRVVSYNILADLYADSEFSRTILFPYCPAYALHIDYRKQLFLKEIIGYNSDIICLQEVDSKIFNLDLEPVLLDDGFKGIFTKKCGQVAEGLALFYKSNRFQMIEDNKLQLGSEIKTSPIFEDLWKMIESNEAFVSRLTDRTTVAQVVALQSLDIENELVVVGNTHLYFHPDADHVRLMQGGIIIRWLNYYIDCLQEKMPTKRISLILCGDFNTVPSCGIYKLYTTGEAPSDLEDWKSNETEALSNVSLLQPRLLKSACGTPEFTNYTVEFADCLDYIFHDKNIKTVQVIPFPSLDELKENTAIPSILFPSDHIALVSDLQFN